MPATINLLNTPDDLSPVNKELWFRVNSASSSVSNYKYVFRINEKIEPFATTSYSSPALYKIPPRPTTGDGLYTPHKLLKSYFDYTINPYRYGWGIHKQGLVKYYIDYGFEFNPDIDWEDTLFSGGYVGLTFSSPHGLLENDIITLDKTNKTINIDYDGTASVTSVPNTYQIVTDIPWGSNTTAETGTIINLQRLTSTSSEYITYNGTRQYDERTTDFTNVYTLVNSSSKFLTNHNSTYKSVFSTDYETISMILNSTTGYDFHVKTYDSGLNELATYTYSISGNNGYKATYFGVGPKNLEALESGITTGVKYYDVYVKSGGATVSDVRTYRIDDNCSPLDEYYRIMFLNRTGGWDYFNFIYDAKKSVDIQRTEYNRITDWDYSIGDRGRTNLSTGAMVTYNIQSDWLTEKDSIWLEELLTSPEVYHITNGDVVYEYGSKVDINSYTNNGGYVRLNCAAAHGLSVGDEIEIFGSPYNGITTVISVQTTTQVTVDVVFTGAGALGAENFKPINDISNSGSMKLPIIITDNKYQTKTHLRDKVFNLSLNFKYAYNINLQNQ